MLIDQKHIGDCLRMLPVNVMARGFLFVVVNRSTECADNFVVDFLIADAFNTSHAEVSMLTDAEIFIMMSVFANVVVSVDKTCIEQKHIKDGLVTIGVYVHNTVYMHFVSAKLRIQGLLTRPYTKSAGWTTRS